MTSIVDGKKIWEEVCANAKKLDECVGPHDFSKPDPADSKLPRRYFCTKCGGWLAAVEVIWYKKGLEHGRKDNKS